MRRLGILLLLLVMLQACGGGGPDRVVASADLPEIVLDHPNQAVIFVAPGKHEGALTLSFGVDPGDFPKCVGNGHFGAMLHADVSSIQTGLHRGGGVSVGLFGNNTEATKDLPNLEWIMIVQSWAVGAPEPYKPILAHMPVPSHFTITTPPGRIVVNGVDIPDPNPLVDRSQMAIVFFLVGDPPLCPSSVRIINPVATWSAAP